MSGWKLLAVMRSTDLPPPSVLAAAGGVEHAEAGDLSVLGAPIGEAPPRRTRRQILAHIKTLETLMPHGTLAPMRFGSVCDGLETAATALATHRGRLDALLERLAGRAEFAIRIAWPKEAVMHAIAAEDPALRDRSRALAARGPEAQGDRIALGRAVAERLAARRDRTERALASRAVSLTDAVRRSEPESDVEALRAALLIAPEREEAVLAAMQAAAVETGFGGDVAPEIKWIGPSPAFSFSETVLDAAAQGRERAWAS